MLDLPRPVVWALIALHTLADRGRPVTESEIARDFSIPKSQLKRVILKLRRLGYIRGKPGQGYILSRSPSEITAMEIVRAFTPSSDDARRCRMDYKTCVFRSACPVAPLCHVAADSLHKALESFTVADLEYEPVTMP